MQSHFSLTNQVLSALSGGQRINPIFPRSTDEPIQEREETVSTNEDGEVLCLDCEEGVAEYPEQVATFCESCYQERLEAAEQDRFMEGDL